MRKSGAFTTPDVSATRLFSACTHSVNRLISASSKSTFVSVANSDSIAKSSTASVRTPGFCRTISANATSAPVSSSCRSAVSASLPQTPARPVQPLHPAVCSHWKQNISPITLPLTFDRHAKAAGHRCTTCLVRRTIGYCFQPISCFYNERYRWNDIFP